MSDQLSKFIEGQGADYRDMQRLATQSAGTPDRVTELLMMPGTVTTTTKRVMPLAAESASVNPHLLLIPSSTTGKLTAQPAWYGVSDKNGSNGAPLMLLAHTQYTAKDTALLGANASGSTKYVAVYGTIAYEVTETGTRPYRDANGKRTQSFDLASATTLTLGMTAQCASKTDALAAVPSDGASAYVLLLGYVTIANGYTSGGTVYQSATGGSTYIEQAWTGGGIDPQRVVCRPASVYASAATYKPSTPLTTRFGAMETFFAGVVIPPTGGTLTLDESMDWRRRFIIVEGAMPPSHAGAYPAPESVTVAGVKVSAGGGAGTEGGFKRPQVFGVVSQEGGTTTQNYNMGFTGTDGGNAVQCVNRGASNNSLNLYLYADSVTGALTLSATGTTYDGASGDNWFFIIRVTPQFVF